MEVHRLHTDRKIAETEKEVRQEYVSLQICPTSTPSLSKGNWKTSQDLLILTL